MPPRWPRGRTSRRFARTDGRHLEPDLPQEQDERARDVEAVGEEGAVAGVGLALGLGAADGEDDVLGLAREQVAAAGAAVDEQADPGRVPALDLRAVRRRGAHEHPPVLLLDPAEGGDVLVGAEQDPGLARAGLRRQVGLPLGEAVAVIGDPAGHVRRAAVAHRGAQHREREPVDLEEDDARARRCPSCAPRRRAIRRVTRTVYSSSSFVPRSTCSTMLTAAISSEASSASPKSPTWTSSGSSSRAMSSSAASADEHEQEAGDEHERQPERGQDRRQHRVEDADQRRDEEGGARSVDAPSPA